jgi:hypothetical protein
MTSAAGEGPFFSSGSLRAAAPFWLRACHMCSITAVPNSEHFTFFAPSIRRAKS